MIGLLTTGLVVAMTQWSAAAHAGAGTAVGDGAPPRIEIVVMRIDADGKAIYACVDSKEAAKRFLEAPLEQVARKAREK